LYPGQRHFGGNIDPGLFVQDLTTADGIGKGLSFFNAVQSLSGRAGFAGRVFCVNDPLAKPCVGTEAGWWFNAATASFVRWTVSFICSIEGGTLRISGLRGEFRFSSTTNHCVFLLTMA
jgi:hypothetical protein